MTSLPSLSHSSVEPYAFADLLAANPADRTARLIYADWLEETGRVAEGEFHRWLANLEPCFVCREGPFAPLPCPWQLKKSWTVEGEMEWELCDYALVDSWPVRIRGKRSGHPAYPTELCRFVAEEMEKDSPPSEHVFPAYRDRKYLSVSYHMAKHLTRLPQAPYRRREWRLAKADAFRFACKLLGIPLPTKSRIP